MFDEQFSQFFPEGFDFMMLLLVLDVFNEPVFLLDGIGKCPIPILPATEMSEEFFPFNEISRGEFNVFR